MLDWLKKQFHNAAGLVPDPIRNYVHAQIHAVMAYLGTIINHVAAAWHSMWKFTDALAHAVDVFGHSVYNYLSRLVRVMIPQALHHLSGKISQLGAWAWGWIKKILHQIYMLEKHLVKLINDGLKWAVKHIGEPLWAEAHRLWETLKKWGYTSWWYITHPAKLADLLLLHLVASLQRGIWNVGRIMGDFLFKTVLSQTARSLTLIEQILSDVL